MRESRVTRRGSNIVLLLGLLCAWIAPLRGVPAGPNACTLTQPNGQVFRAVQHGNEYFSYYQTLDGSIIQLDSEDGYWYYARLDTDGQLVATQQVVSQEISDSNSTDGERLTWRDAVALGATRDRSFKTDMVTNDLTIPASGTLRGVLLMVNFSDTQVTHSRTDFQNLMNQTGFDQYGAHGSARDYYAEVSYGKLDLVFDVFGWFNLPKTKAYYGYNSSEGKDVHLQELVYEAISQADASVDFRPYDSNRDGFIDFFGILHQGQGEEEGGASSDCIWSRYGEVYPRNTADHVDVKSFFVVPELYGNNLATIGVFCHEIGHLFNLPDLTDLDGSSHGVGMWSLMGSGCWLGPNNHGTKPGHFDPWSKMCLGWLTPRVMYIPEQDVSLLGYDQNPDALLIPVDPYQDGEYFLVTNRHQRHTDSEATGFDAYIPGSGALILHVEEYMDTNAEDAYRKVDVEEADGQGHLDRLGVEGNPGDANDLFVDVNDAFNHASWPNSHDLAGNATYIGIRDFQGAGTSHMTCDITPQAMLAGQTIYYDVIGSRGIGIGYGDGADYACVRFQADEDGVLERVKTFFVYEGETKYTLVVYQGISREGFPSGMIHRQLGNHKGRGYEEISLDKPMRFKKGEQFCVEIEFDTRFGYRYPLPIVGDGNPSGRSYVRDRDSHAYQRLTAIDGLPYDLLIRANMKALVPSYNE